MIDQVEGDDNIIATADQQWAALDCFIENDDYLSGRRGDYAKQNKSRTPSGHVADLKLARDPFLAQGNTKHLLQVSFDIFNFTNMLNENWGRRYFVGRNAFPILNPVFGNDGLEGFLFTDPGDSYDIVQTGTYNARWIAQAGLRHRFWSAVT